MADDTLREFAGRLAAKVALAKADHDAPEDALFAIGQIMHEAKQDPSGWLEANRQRPPAGRAEPQPASKVPTPSDIWRARARARQTGSGR